MNFDNPNETITPINAIIPVRVNGTGLLAASGVSSVVLPYTAGTGNLLTASGGIFILPSGYIGIGSCIDNLGNNWTVVEAPHPTNGFYAFCCYLNNCPTGITSVTITMASATTVEYVASVDEWSGVTASTPLDQQSLPIASNTTNSLSTGNITNVNTSDLMLAIAASRGGTIASWSVNANWNVLAEATTIVVKTVFMCADNNIGPFGTQFTYFGDNTLGMSALIISFKNNTATTESKSLIINSTTAIELPVGSSAQRPSSPAVGQIRYNSDEDIIEGYASNNSIVLSPTVIPKTLVQRKRRYLIDDFMLGSSAINGLGVFGELGWTQTSSANPTNSYSGSTDHPGILTLGTGAVSGNNLRMSLGNAVASNILLESQIDYFSFLIRIPTITTMTLLMGLGQTISSTTFGTAGIWFQFAPASSASLQFISRTSGTSAFGINTVTVAANTWYFIEAINDGEQWVPVVNGVTYAAQSFSNLSSGLNAGLILQTGAASVRSVDWDYFSMITSELGRRY